MSEAIKWTDLDRSASDQKDRIIGILILEAMTKAVPVDRGGKSDFTDKFAQNKDSDGEVILDICMTVNGTEVPFRETMHRLIDAIDGEIEAQAAKKIETMVRDKFEEFSEAIDDVKRKVKRTFGIDPDEEYY